MPRTRHLSGVTNDVMTLLRQQVLDKNSERFIGLLRGREVQFGDFDEPTGQAMLHYMSNYVEQNRICTKDTDLVSAVAPAIGVTANANGSLVEGVTKLIRHIEYETRTIFVGPLPCGILDSSDGSVRSHPRAFKGLNDLSNVGKISFLHGTQFANNDLLANVDDQIRVESILTDPDRYSGHEVGRLLDMMALSQKRMLARWLALWEPQPQRDGSGIFDEAFQFLARVFAGSKATIEGSIWINLRSEITIRSATQLTKFCLMLLRVFDSETSDLGDAIVSRCELVKITNVSQDRTAVGYQRKGAVSKLVAVGDCLLLVDATDNTSVVGRVPYTDRDALGFLSCSTIRIGGRSTDPATNSEVGEHLPIRLSKIVRDTITSIRENQIEFVDLGGGHVDDDAAVALCGALASNTSVKCLLLENNRISARGRLAIDRMLTINRTLDAVHLPSVNDSDVVIPQSVTADSRVVQWTHATQTNWRRLFVAQHGGTTIVDSNSVSVVSDQALLALGEVNKYWSTSSLHLHNVAIHATAMRALARGLARNTTIAVAELKQNALGDDEINVLARAIQINTTIEILTIQGSEIRASGAQHLGDALETNTSIQDLSLSENRIDDDSAEALAHGLQYNTHLSELDLRGNCIGDRGAQALAAALGQRLELTVLLLEHNCVGDAGVTALAHVLKTDTMLSQLHFSRNRIGDDGAKALAESLATNDSLRTLDLRHNEIGDEGAAALALALAHNETLVEMNLSHNRIGNDGARAFLEPLRATTTLEKLNLKGNAGIKTAVKDELKDTEDECAHRMDVTVEEDAVNFPISCTQKIGPTGSTSKNEHEEKRKRRRHFSWRRGRATATKRAPGTRERVRETYRG